MVTLIFSNRKYQILQYELHRPGFDHPKSAVLDVMDLSRPDLDWVKLAQAMGVNGLRAETEAAFTDLTDRALAEPGPHLIELRLSE